MTGCSLQGDLFAVPRKRWVPGKVYRYAWGEMVHCFRDPSTPHGEGHNAVVVCGCEDCRGERAQHAIDTPRAIV